MSTATAGRLRAGPSADFRSDIRPLLKEYCYDCHGEGESKGKVALDAFDSDAAAAKDPELWWRVLKNVRAGLMPPEKKARPSEEQKALLGAWIKSAVFGYDPRNPDPGRVTVRRLNRVEYKNTIRDLMGVEFDTAQEFPADDTGHGFDNIGDVLTLPPMLLEKYLEAARTIVSKAVPAVPAAPAERPLDLKAFVRSPTSLTNAAKRGPLVFSYYEPGFATNTIHIAQAGRYTLSLSLTANEKFVDNVFDLNKCRLRFLADGQALLDKSYNREGGTPFRYEFETDWKAGDHIVSFEVRPEGPSEKQVRDLTLRVDSVLVRGPMERRYWTHPKNFDRFFTKDAPKGARERRQYARQLLGDFASRAYRRPAGEATAERLAALAESVYDKPGAEFEAGVAQAMVAVLASPRFLFREEATAPGAQGAFPLLDDYSLASRLSYFLWATMPDEELRRLAAAGELRKNLPAQVARMLADARSQAFVQNFIGQWLQARDVDTVVIDARTVLNREAAPDPRFERVRARFRELNGRPAESLSKEEKEELATVGAEFRRSFRPPRAELTGELRTAMRQETEKYFEYVMRQDRPLAELLDSDYTFLNEKLAKHYGITNVAGSDMRRVTLEPGSPRGGLLTQGTVLTVTSNPTRTSPVKRGVFLLDNILGMPAPPPPPNIPALEETAKSETNRTLTLRQTLEIHRAKPLCSSCHDRMDPLGLALENFNALGMWRERDSGAPVEAGGRLREGEAFEDVRGLKRILVAGHLREFHRCVAEKLMTYALGRGLGWGDVGAVDAIVDRLEAGGGRFSALLSGVIESPAFQRRRAEGVHETLRPAGGAGQRADLNFKP